MRGILLSMPAKRAVELLFIKAFHDICCSSMQIAPVYAAVYVASMLFPALATIFKEKIFNDAKQKLGGKQLDIFVVGIQHHLKNVPCLYHACPVEPVLPDHLLYLSALCQTHSCLA